MPNIKIQEIKMYVKYISLERNTVNPNSGSQNCCRTFLARDLANMYIKSKPCLKYPT